MDIELNCADGQGLIDPDFAVKWAEDMHLSYVPCSFVARSCFIKGNLATFDFKEFAHVHKINTIKDKWGKITFDTLRMLLPNSIFESFQVEFKTDPEKTDQGFHIYQYGFRRIETEEDPW